MSASTAADASHLVEVFSSVQGEGPYVGMPTLFVRFGECDLRCAWCDSPGTWMRRSECRVETRAGSGDFRSLPNPVALDLLLDCIDALAPATGDLVSLTGGEPLLQPKAVRALAEQLQGRGLRVYLETHGLAVDALESLAPLCDVISMDWKLASDVRRVTDPRHGSVADFHATHQRFLRAAQPAGEVFVKVVLTPASRDDELDALCEHIAGCAPQTPLVLQPVTPQPRVRERPSPEQLLAWMRRCRERLADVRLIPQTHPVYGVR